MSRPALRIAGIALASLAAFVPRPAGAEADHVIVLPPFLVEEQETKPWLNRPIWSHGEAGNIEILSACPEDETQLFIEGLRTQRMELGQIIPDEFLLHTALPTTFILFPQSLKSTMDADLTREWERLPAASAAHDRLRPLDDLRLTDPDSSYLFVILNDAKWKETKRGSEFIFSPSYLRFLLEARTPALPAWFCEGATHFYESILIPWDKNGFEPDPWLSKDAASVLHEDAFAPRPFLPLRELFIPALPAGRTEQYRHVWNAQAELFIRWALSGKVPGGRDRLWRFAAAAAVQPVTEELFKSCFGMDYDDARNALSDYLPQAVWEPLKGPSAPSSDIPPMALHDATPSEIHRIKGEWGRRVLSIVKEYNPEAVPIYSSQTRQLLQGSFDRGERDPRLVASLALFRLDTENSKGARELLEASPAARSARPLAVLELASLRLAEALDAPSGSNARLSEGQASGILECVAASLGKKPAIEGAYVIAATVARHLGREPSDSERARLNEGAHLFPQNSELVFQSAAWDLRAGAVAEARRLIEMGLWEATNPSARLKLLDLEAVGPLGTGW